MGWAAEDDYEATYGREQAKIRRRLKNKLMGEATMGTKAGQWSARKSQELKRRYEAACERKGLKPYKGSKTTKQKDLSDWSKQGWRTASGRKSSVTGEPYFPAKAVQALKERDLYSKAKRQKAAATRAGKQRATYSKDIQAVVARYRAEGDDRSVPRNLDLIMSDPNADTSVLPSIDSIPVARSLDELKKIFRESRFAIIGFPLTTYRGVISDPPWMRQQDVGQRYDYLSTLDGGVIGGRCGAFAPLGSQSNTPPVSLDLSVALDFAIGRKSGSGNTHFELKHLNNPIVYSIDLQDYLVHDIRLESDESSLGVPGGIHIDDAIPIMEFGEHLDIYASETLDDLDSDTLINRMDAIGVMMDEIVRKHGNSYEKAERDPTYLRLASQHNALARAYARREGFSAEDFVITEPPMDIEEEAQARLEAIRQLQWGIRVIERMLREGNIDEAREFARITVEAMRQEEDAARDLGLDPDRFSAEGDASFTPDPDLPLTEQARDQYLFMMPDGSALWIHNQDWSVGMADMKPTWDSKRLSDYGGTPTTVTYMSLGSVDPVDYTDFIPEWRPGMSFPPEDMVDQWIDPSRLGEAHNEFTKQYETSFWPGLSLREILGKYDGGKPVFDAESDDEFEFPHHDPDWLYEHYVVQGLSAQDIAGMLGVPVNMVTRRIHEFGLYDVESRTGRARSGDRYRTARVEETKDLLSRGYSTKEIAEILGVSDYTVRTYRREIRNQFDAEDDPTSTAVYIGPGNHLSVVDFIDSDHFVLIDSQPRTEYQGGEHEMESWMQHYFMDQLMDMAKALDYELVDNQSRLNDQNASRMTFRTPSGQTIDYYYNCVYPFAEGQEIPEVMESLSTADRLIIAGYHPVEQLLDDMPSLDQVYLYVNTYYPTEEGDHFDDFGDPTVIKGFFERDDLRFTIMDLDEDYESGDITDQYMEQGSVGEYGGYPEAARQIESNYWLEAEDDPVSRIAAGTNDALADFANAHDTDDGYYFVGGLIGGLLIAVAGNIISDRLQDWWRSRSA